MIVKKLIYEFLDLVKPGEVSIYNEASLQFELGWYLKENCGGAKIQVERGVTYFGFDKTAFVKRDMDLIIFFEGFITVIELKAPIEQSVARPVTVFNWIKDLRFLEQLKAENINGYSIFITDNLGYLNDNGKAGNLLTDIRSRTLKGEYHSHKKPSDEDEIISLDFEYKLDWQEMSDGLFSCLIEV